MSSTLMWILYGVLIVVLGVVGYFIGKNYDAVGTKIGTGLGVASGLLVAGVIWYSQSEEFVAAF